MTLDPKRLSEDQEATSAELCAGVQRLRSQVATSEQMAKLAAGLAAAGVSVGASTAHAAGGAQAAGAGHVAAKSGIALGWKLGLLGGLVAAAIVAVMPHATAPVGVGQHATSSSDQLSMPSESQPLRRGVSRAGSPALREPTPGKVIESDLGGTPEAPRSASQSEPEPSSLAPATDPAPLRGDSNKPPTAGERLTNRHVTEAPFASPKGTPRSASAAESATSVQAPRRSEVELLQTASTVLGSNPAEALSLCEEHRATYPKGAMTQEREVIAITALVRLGRRDQAVQRANRFRSNYPTSAYLRQLDLLKLSP